MTVEAVRIISCFAGKSFAGSQLLDELLSPVLEPAQQLGAIIMMANSIAEDVICDRAKRIRESKRILEGRRKEEASWRWAWTLCRGARFFTALRHSNFVICRGYFEHPYISPSHYEFFLAAVTAGRGWEGDR
jgi:hypothetical protein